MFEGLFDGALFDSVVRSVIPILAASLGGMICDRAGVFQISLEGMMLTGAFAAVAGSFLGQSSLVGVVFGMASAALLSLVLAYGAVTRRGDPIVLGVAVNLLALGLTSFLLAQIFGVRGVFQHDRIDGLDRIPIPGLSEMGVVGPVIFRMTIPAYLTMIGVAATWVFLFRTKLGLRLRGVGERPLSAETLGVNSARYKYGAVVASGLLCGLAGAQLALGNVVQFAENMTSGRGWIAVVAVLLGRAHPLGVLGASALFGLTEALGFRLQGHARLPVQITDALPFVVTLVALAIARRRFTRLLEFGVAT